MLMITRRPGESVAIDVPASTTATRIEIHVRSANRQQARMGIDAPRCVAIQRLDGGPGPRPAADTATETTHG